jgi:hypothetical protein
MLLQLQLDSDDESQLATQTSYLWNQKKTWEWIFLGISTPICCK